VNPIWPGVAIAEDVATAGSGVANAAYFAHRGAASTGPRRLGALLLTLVFAAIALDAIAYLALADPSAEGALLRAPLLLANVAIGVAIAAGAGR
jgi:hypothetical protein